MQFSIFTPTHKHEYLAALYSCLKNQTNSDWEWIILQNITSAVDEKRDFSDNWHNLKSDLIEKFIPEAINDSRVKVYRAPITVAKKGIGALKKYACTFCTGDYLVEIDHDDLVREDMLEVMTSAIGNNNYPDVLYSDFAEFLPDGSPHYYGPENGWESYYTQWNGNNYIAMKAFEPSPATLSRIWYAPNHVRIFKRTTYWDIGGHNEELFVCDDHELLCRLYAGGSKFLYVPECLYFYRMLPQFTDGVSQNSYLIHNEKIQVDNITIGDAYLNRMIDTWADNENGVKLDMGGAHNKPKSYLSVDMWGEPNIKLDITKEALPYPDNSVSVIRCSDFLEHIKPEYVVQVMNEFYRVLRPGGYLVTFTPAFPSKGAVQDPTHVSFWCSNSFWYYADTTQRAYNHEFKGLFHLLKNVEYYPTDWHVSNDIKYVDCVMVKLAGNKVPGSNLSLIEKYHQAN